MNYALPEKENPTLQKPGQEMEPTCSARRSASIFVANAKPTLFCFCQHTTSDPIRTEQKRKAILQTRVP